MSHKVLLILVLGICIGLYPLLWTKLTCYNLTKVPQLTKSPLDARIYDKVKIFLLFIGYNRSRHTLLSSLLDAHPNVIIANDFNILKDWIENPLLAQRNKHYIYELLLAKSRYDVMFGVRSRSVGTKPVKYHYNVKDQWQGIYNNSIQVIGDKKAAQASKMLRYPDAMKSLKKLEIKLGAQLKFIHVMRNPYDNIATMTLRRADEVKKKQQLSVKLNYSRILDGSIASYGELAQGSYEVMKNFPGRVLDVPSIDVMTNTRGILQEICDFLEIKCTEKYLQDCASIVDPVPSKTRGSIVWTEDQIKRVQKLIKHFPFFRRYSLEFE